MKKLPTIILRYAVFAAGTVVLAICGVAVWLTITEPNPESEYYILVRVLFAGAFTTAVPFFIALYQALKLLGYIDTNRAFSELSVKALKIIINCTYAVFAICTMGGSPFFYAAAQVDDAPGLVIIGMTISGGAFVITVFASVLKRLLQDAIQLKFENDLTI